MRARGRTHTYTFPVGRYLPFPPFFRWRECPFSSFYFSPSAPPLPTSARGKRERTKESDSETPKNSLSRSHGGEREGDPPSVFIGRQRDGQRLPRMLTKEFSSLLRLLSLFSYPRFPFSLLTHLRQVRGPLPTPARYHSQQTRTEMMNFSIFFFKTYVII